MKLEDLAVFASAFVRCAAFLQAFPLTGDNVVPPKFRGAIAVLLALCLAPSRRPENLFVALPAEALLGFAAGFAGRVVFAGIEAGGQLIGYSIGLGFAAQYDSSTAEEELPTRRLVRCLTLLGFFAGNGLPLTIAALIRPPPTAATLLRALQLIIDETGRVMVVGLRLAAPAMVASLIGYIATGIAARSAPSLNVFSIAIPLVLIISGFTLLAVSPLTIGEMALAVSRVPDQIGRVLGLL